VSAPSYYDQVQRAAELVQSKSKVIPETAIVLGSGLGDFASTLDRATSIPYDAIPNWPSPSVIGHECRLVIGDTAGQVTICQR
jgi:purine-nucleoside phosphorylase